ncbi:MAG: hypothetical protein ACKO4A_07370 [Gammaproteobacteria bacterium]
MLTLLLLALAGCGATPQITPQDPPLLAALRGDMPPDVSDFIRRAVMCNHWAGEEAYDEDRHAQIDSAQASLGCSALDGDQAALRLRHVGQAGILGRIEESRRTPY